MIKTKIIYAVLILISVVFFILYIQPFSLYLLIFVLLLPVFLGICVILANFFVTAKVSSDCEYSVKNTDIRHILSITNKTPLPFSNCRVRIEYYNKLMNVSETLDFNVPIHPLGTEKLVFFLRSQYCGVLTVRVTHMRIFDYIKLFSSRKKTDSVCSTVIVPEIYLPVSKSEYSSIFTEESDVFSKTKSGDDPSEIFALKDFVPGDKPNRIHWNLSLKHDNLIVRHYSQPICTSYLIVLDFNAQISPDGIKLLDAAAETAFSIAYLLLERKIQFKLAFHDKKADTVRVIDIADNADIINTFRMIFENGPSLSAETVTLIKEHGSEFSEIFYITPSEENLSAVSGLAADCVTPVIIRNRITGAEKNCSVSVVYTDYTEKGISELII